MKPHHDLSTHENWLRDLTLQISLVQRNYLNSPQDPNSESDSEVIIKASSQSPETSDTEATFHTPPKNHPLWAEGSVGSALQIIEGRRSTFVIHWIDRTPSVSSIFHPDHLIRERHPTHQKRETPSKTTP